MNTPSLTMHRVSIALATIVLLVLVVLQTRFSSVIDPSSAFLPTHAVAAGHIWQLDVANTESSRALGLGERDSYPKNRGMLFLFEPAYPYGFWMKGMRFPLDMVFLDRGKIVFIERGIRPEDKRIVAPPVPVDQVLELNAGGAKDLSVGDRIWYWRSF